VLVAIVAATLIDQLVRSYQPANRRAVLSWEAAVSPIVAGSNSLGAVLANFRSTAASEPRATLDATLQALQLGTAQQARSAAALGIGPPSAHALALLTTTLHNRAAAVQTLATAVDDATGPDRDLGSATTRLVTAGSELQRADSAYHQLRGIFNAQHDDVLPDSRWLEDPARYNTTAAGDFATALAAMPGLAERSRLGIVALSIDPSPDRIEGLPTTTVVTTPPHPTTTTSLSPPTTLSTTGSSVVTTTTTTSTTVPPTTTTLAIPPAGSRSYLLPTATIRVSVVVRNAGAIPLANVAVSASLTPLADELSNDVPRVHATIGTMTAGRSTSVALAPLAVPKNQTCQLRVEVTAPGAGSVSETVTLVTSR
jgi:hypothetical protein